MGYYSAIEKTYLPSKNRVGGFDPTCITYAGESSLQVVEVHQENEGRGTTLVSGVTYYGYRYYNPSTGRFLSKDPIAENGGLNLYGFVKNDPVNLYDALGKRPSRKRVGTYEASDFTERYIYTESGGWVDREHLHTYVPLYREIYKAASAKDERRVEDGVEYLVILIENIAPRGPLRDVGIRVEYLVPMNIINNNQPEAIARTVAYNFAIREEKWQGSNFGGGQNS